MEWRTLSCSRPSSMPTFSTCLPMPYLTSKHMAMELKRENTCFSVSTAQQAVPGVVCPVHHRETERGSAKTNQGNQHRPVILANVFQDDSSSIEPEGHEDGRRRQEADGDAGHQRAVGLGAHGGRHGVAGRPRAATKDELFPSSASLGEGEDRPAFICPREDRQLLIPRD